MAAKIKKGDKVMVLTGKDKGKIGEVMKILSKDNRAFVQGVNVAKRHTRPGMTFGNINPLHKGSIIFAEDFHNFTNFALIFAGQYHNFIALFYFSGHHNTSGASEIIFINCLARNSRVTGPKIRVPIGSF